MDRSDWFRLGVCGCLSGIVVSVVAGVVAVSLEGRDPPPWLTGVGGTAVGLLAGVIGPLLMRVRDSEKPGNGAHPTQRPPGQPPPPPIS